MANILEEKLREAAAIGDNEVVQALIAQNTDINSKNVVNGWTALHWASRRGHEEIVRILLNNGADTKIETNKGEKPTDVCRNPNILSLLGENPVNANIYLDEQKFTPNYLRNPPLNGQVDIGPKLRTRHSDFFTMPTTVLPAQTDGKDLVLKIRIAGSSDPDFIEVEVPRWKLTYNTLMKICCDELEISDTQVERIRKLPNTRLRKDSDVKRLLNFHCLEIVMKTLTTTEKYSNSYQSISTHKDQTILY